METVALFDTYPRRNHKILLLDIAIVNPCINSNLESTVLHGGKHLSNAVERKNNKYRCPFPVTYSLLPVDMSTCG